MFVNGPAQFPLNTLKFIEVTLPVTLFKETVCTGPLATKENHTSSSAVPTHGVTTCPDAVAPNTDPKVWEAQVWPAFTVTGSAPAQLSFAGGPTGGVVTQMLNVVVTAVEPLLYTRK